MLHKPASPAARDAEVDQGLDTFVDYDELTRRAFGEPCHPSLPNCEDLWASYNDEQKREVTDLLKQLVRKSYRKNLLKTLDYDIAYRGTKDQAGRHARGHRGEEQAQAPRPAGPRRLHRQADAQRAARGRHRHRELEPDEELLRPVPQEDARPQRGLPEHRGEAEGEDRQEGLSSPGTQGPASDPGSWQTKGSGVVETTSLWPSVVSSGMGRTLDWTRYARDPMPFGCPSPNGDG